MQVAEFAADGKNRIKGVPPTPFAKTSLKNFAKDDKVLIVNTKKFSIFNKSPAVVKVFSRSNVSSNADVTLAGPLLDVFTLSYDSDAFVVLLANGTIDIYRIGELPDATLNVTPSRLVFPESIVAASACNAQSGVDRSSVALTAVTGSGSVYLVASALDSPSVRPIGSVGNVSGAANGSTLFRSTRQTVAIARPHGEANVYEFAADGSSWKTALAKPWFPHGDDACTALHVCSKRVSSGGVRIITASASNNEVRLWNVDKGNVSLLQTLSVKNSSDTVKRLFSVDSDDAFIYLPVAADAAGAPASPVAAAPAATTSNLVVFALDEALKAVRGTEWAIESLIAVSPALVKVKSATGETRYERTLISRSAAEVSRVMLEGRYLEGAPNLLPLGNAAPSPSGSTDVRKWFDNTPAVAHPAVTVAPSPYAAMMMGPQMTEINSNGQSTVTTHFDASTLERQIRDALQGQQDNYASTFSKLNEGVKQLERLASQTSAAIRQPQTIQRLTADITKKAAAQTFEACRNAATGMATGAPAEIAADLKSIERICDEVRVQGQRVANAILTRTMTTQLNTVIERAWQTVTGPSQERDIQLPKPSQLPSVQEFCETVDKAHAAQGDLFRRQKEQDSAKIKSILTRTMGSAEVSLTNNRAYMARLKQSVDRLSAAVKDAAVVAPVGSAQAAAASSAPVSDESVLQQALKLAEAGRWKDSLKTIVELAKAPLLLRYLEADVVKNNRASVASESTLSIPIYLSLMQQLSSDLRASIGLVPARLEWMLEFVMAFDAALTDPKNQSVLQALAVQFSIILDSLNTINDKQDLDAASRRSMRLVKKAVEAIAA